MTRADIEDTLRFLRSAERLKDTTRSAHTSGGRRESVAEHSWRLCLMVLAFETGLRREIPGLDVARLLGICLVHDLGEALGGDVPAPEAARDAAGRAGKAERERRDLLELLAPLPAERREAILALWDEYDAAVTPEARLAKGLDKLETLLQHVQGDNPPGFDHRFNLTYGREHTGWPPLVDAVRRVLDEATEACAPSAERPVAGAPDPPRPVAPVWLGPLLLPLHGELLEVLEGLEPEAWERPTLAGEWRVRDVAAHLLDGDLRTLSALRDGHRPRPDRPIGEYRELVAFLDDLNAGWVEASRRLSPQVLVELLAVAGPRAAGTLADLPPHGGAAFPVAWAGEARSENWMHVGREYTERWHHQMQIREAVGAPLLLEPRWLRPALDIALRALPHAYRDVEARPGTTLAVRVDDPPLLVRTLRWEERGGRTLLEGAPSDLSASIDLDADTAWRTLHHAVDPEAASRRSRTSGPPSVTRPFFQVRSVMV